MQTLVFPNISPIAVTVFGFDVYWYSLAYLFGVSLGYLLLKRLNKRSNYLTPTAIDDLVFYSVVGIIVGARLGFCLIYDLPYTLHNPVNLLMIRNGGMSFHGGLVGVVIAVILIAKKYQVPFLKIADLLVCVAPIGLLLGRLANFINAEIYGKITTCVWGIVFPSAGELPRHPTQLYEAFGEGLVLLIVMTMMHRKFHERSGFLTGFFLVWYGLVRIIVEFYKEPENLDILFLTMGQALSLPMVIAGALLVMLSSKAANTTDIKDLHKVL